MLLIGRFNDCPLFIECESVPKITALSVLAKTDIFLSQRIADPLGPKHLPVIRFVLARLGIEIEIEPYLGTAPVHRPPGTKVHDPAVRSPTVHGRVAGLGRPSGGNSKRTGNEPAEEGPASTDSTQGEGLLLRRAQGIIMPRAAIRQITFNNTRVAPFLIGVGDVVRPELAKHLTPPGGLFIGVRVVCDEATFPGVKIFELRIQFFGKVGLFKMQVTCNLTIRIAVIGKNNSVHASSFFLPVQPRLMKSGAESETLQDTRLPRQLARLEDRGVNFHGLAIFASIRAARLENLIHQLLIVKKLIEQGLVGLALLRELGQSCWCAMPQNRGLHQLAIQNVAGQQSLKVGEQRPGTIERLRLRQWFGRLVGFVCRLPGIFSRSLKRAQLSAGGFKSRLLVRIDRRQGCCNLFLNHIKLSGIHFFKNLPLL